MIAVTVLSDIVNNVVVRVEGRRLPALVVQGDRLHVWYKLAQAGDEESIKMLQHEMQLSVVEFERVCQENGFPLPY